jgi:hypothetical protein
MKLKPLILPSIVVALLASALSAHVFAQSLSPGNIDFGKLPPPASGDFVEVNINSNLIAMVASVGKQAEPEIAELVRNLQRIRVSVIGLDDGNRPAVQQRVKAIRSDLDAQGWERVVAVQNEGDDVVVHVKMRGGDAVEGVAVTVLSGTKQAVLVNVIGDIRPEKLAVIGERFDIEPLKKLHLGGKK